jgi:MATE family multidrug resistance protein
MRDIEKTQDASQEGTPELESGDAQSPESFSSIHRYPPGSYRQVLVLAYPVILTMISQTVMWLVDTIMVGRLGTAQLGAVGLAGNLIWTAFAFFNGLMASANTFIAQDYGAKRYRDIGKIVWHYLYIAVASYLVLLAFVPVSGSVLRLIRPSAEVEEYASVYIRIRLYSGIGVFTSFAVAGFFRGLGNTITPMCIALVANAFNVIANYLLIFGKFGFPRLEVTGAALATLLSSMLSAVLYVIICLSHKYSKIYCTRSFYRMEFILIRRVVRVGLPMGVQFFLDSASFSVFGAFIARMGDASLAASNAAITLMSTSFMPLVGISVATTTLVGQFIGAKQLEHARKSGYTAIKLGILYAALVASNFFIFPKRLISVISRDPEVMNLGAKILMLAGIFQLSDGFGICANGALRGAGDTRFIMVVGLSYAWFLFLPLAYFFGYTLGGGVVGAWIGATVYIITYGITVFMRFRRGKWESIQI